MTTTPCLTTPTARWEALGLDARARAARRLLRIPAANGALDFDAYSVARRHLLIWLLLAGGHGAGVSEVAGAAGVTHPAVVKVRGKLKPWPHQADVAVMRLIEWAALYAAGKCGAPTDREAGIRAAYATLRGDGWPWKRSGKAGNRGRPKGVA